MIEFRYPPIIVPISMPDDVIFATMYTTHYRWLYDQGASFEVSSYRWPEALSRLLCRHVGTVVCELQVAVADEVAEAYGELYTQR
jgi:hypothetical protein